MAPGSCGGTLSPARYDAIVLDAFVAGKIPGQFLTPNFHRLAKARLSAGGIVLINMVVLDDDDPCSQPWQRQ